MTAEDHEMSLLRLNWFIYLYIYGRLHKCKYHWAILWIAFLHYNLNREGYFMGTKEQKTWEIERCTQGSWGKFFLSMIMHMPVTGIFVVSFSEQTQLKLRWYLKLKPWFDQKILDKLSTQWMNIYFFAKYSIRYTCTIHTPPPKFNTECFCFS